MRKKTTEYVGSFGTGKTTFLENYFKDNTKFEAIWFNAYNFDFSDNPKVTFINEVLMSIYEKSDKKDKTKELLTKGLKKSWSLMKGTILNKAGIATSKVKSSDWDNEINKYETTNQKINKLKSALTAIIKTIDKDVVLVIDDLDRARPDFALEIIEISKHILDVENLSIMFVYDSKTMKSITKKKYGIFPNERYLAKYIDNTFQHENATMEDGGITYYSKSVLNILYPNMSIRAKTNFDEKYGFESYFGNPNLYGRNTAQIYNESMYILEAFFISVKINDPELLLFVVNKQNDNISFANPIELEKKLLLILNHAFFLEPLKGEDNNYFGKFLKHISTMKEFKINGLTLSVLNRVLNMQIVNV